MSCLCVVRCSLGVVCCLLFVNVLLVVGCWLSTVFVCCLCSVVLLCCSIVVLRCAWFVVYCLSYGVRCLLFGGC